MLSPGFLKGIDPNRHPESLREIKAQDDVRHGQLNSALTCLPSAATALCKAHQRQLFQQGKWPWSLHALCGHTTELLTVLSHPKWKRWFYCHFTADRACIQKWEKAHPYVFIFHLCIQMPAGVEPHPQLTSIFPVVFHTPPADFGLYIKYGEDNSWTYVKASLQQLLGLSPQIDPCIKRASNKGKYLLLPHGSSKTCKKPRKGLQKDREHGDGVGMQSNMQGLCKQGGRSLALTKPQGQAAVAI